MMCLTMDAYPPTTTLYDFTTFMFYVHLFVTVYNESLSPFYKLIKSHVYVQNAKCCENLRQLFIIYMFVLYLTKNCNSKGQ